MKSIRAFAILLFVLQFYGSLQNEFTSSKKYISKTSIQFYYKVNSILKCGSDGYLQSFGIPYSQAFLRKQSLYENQIWLDEVRVCLMEQLYDYLIDDSKSHSCDAVKEYAFSSHVGCYVQPDINDQNLSFCTIPLHDQALTAWIARGALWKLIKKAPIILEKCFQRDIERYEKYIEQIEEYQIQEII